MFKWGANITLEPDLEEVDNYCNDNYETSYLLRDFASMCHFLNADDNPDTPAEVATAQIATVAVATPSTAATTAEE